MSQSHPVPAWRADLALTIIALIWGSTFVLVKNALAEASTMLFLTLRFSIATIALAILYRGHLSGRETRNRFAVRGGVLAGVVLMASYFFQTQGLRFTTASKSAFITGLSVVVVPFSAGGRL